MYQSSAPGWRSTSARASGYWNGWNIAITRGDPGQLQPPGLGPGEAPRRAERQAPERAVGHPGGLDGGHGGRAQEVLGLVVLDESVQRARQQQDGGGLGGHRAHAIA